MNWLDRQITKIRELQNASNHKEREDGHYFGWNTPVGAIAEAYSTITRVIVASAESFIIATTDRRYVAEECRKAGHYLLRAAALLDGQAYLPEED